MRLTLVVAACILIVCCAGWLIVEFLEVREPLARNLKTALLLFAVFGIVMAFFDIIVTTWVR